MPSDKDLDGFLEAETREGSTGLRPAGALLVPGLTVLFHPDVERIGERVALTGLAAGRRELLSRGEPAFAPPHLPRRQPLGDVHLSRRPIVLAPGAEPGSVLLSCADTATAVAVDGEPVAGERTLSAAEVARGAVLLLANRVVLALSLLDPVAAPQLAGFGLVGESASMTLLRREIRRVAGLAVPALVRGETGTGKELVARALHEAGPRAAKPFLAVNMGAVPGTLAAAELFGAVRGAYTGADQMREGYFRRAHGGTLFLDEIGETPPEVQPLLLRVLESGEVQPVGGGEARRVDVRLVAATDADLEGAAAAGRFRAPLLHRLGGYQIRLPPLRERREDFGRLLLHFLRQELAPLDELDRLDPPAPGVRPWLPAELVARLAAHDWPGNVRQLRNVVRQMVIAGRDGGEAAMWLQAEAAFRDATPHPPADRRETAPEIPAEVIRRARRSYRRPDEVGEGELVAALRANRWRLQPTAAQLGISRGSLYDRIEKSSTIRKAADLGREEIAECLERCGGDLDAMVERLEVSKRGLQRRMLRLGMS